MEKTVFKQGDRVFHIEYGWGEIDEVDSGRLLHVRFDSGSELFFYTDGKMLQASKISLLSFTEYTLEGFSQERSVELPEVGEEVMVSWNGYQWSLGNFHEYKNGVFYTIDDKRTWIWNHLKRIR